MLNVILRLNVFMEHGRVMNIALRCDFFVLDDAMLRYRHFHSEC